MKNTYISRILFSFFFHFHFCFALPCTASIESIKIFLTTVVIISTPEMSADTMSLADQDSKSEEIVLRRNLPGTTSRELFVWPTIDVSEAEFGEYIQQQLRLGSRDVVAISKLPDDSYDEKVWIFENMRQFLMDCNFLICALAGECNEESCPKMIVSKWEILCAAHKKPKECCAIDYVIHNLAGFRDMLNNKDLFPSRIKIPAESMDSLKSIPRRLVRLFAHAFFHHRKLFDSFENKTLLCSRFIAFAKMFKLLGDKDIMIPIDQLPIKITE